MNDARRTNVVASDDGVAMRTYEMVAAEMQRRFGIRLSRVRVMQICQRAEEKIARKLARFK